MHILHSDIFFSSITRLDRNESRAQTFRYRRLLSKQNQNILNWSAYYWNKSRTFQSVPKLFKIESEHFGVFIKFKNETRIKPSLLFIESKHFHTPMLQRNQNWTFVFSKNYIRTKKNVSNCARIFERQNKTFLCSQKIFEMDQN